MRIADRKVGDTMFGMYAAVVLALALVPVATLTTCVSIGLVAVMLGGSPGWGWLGLFVGPIVGSAASIVIAHRIIAPCDDDTGQCARCGYTLAGLTSARCPECGEAVSVRSSDAT